MKPRSKAPRRKMRDISADCIGALATFKGIVTQVRALGLVLACTAVQPAAGVDVAAVWALWERRWATADVPQGSLQTGGMCGMHRAEADVADACML